MKRPAPDRFAATLGLLLALLPFTALADETPHQKWAVLVGVNQYANLNPLKYCQRDAEALRDRLVQAGFPKENVFLLTSGSTDPNELPVKHQIEKKLKVVLGLAEEGDMVLVTFSGHGISLSGRTFLCPAEADVEAPEKTMVALDYVYEALTASKASQKMLWVDACRNDPRRGGSRDTYTKSLEGVSKALPGRPARVSADPGDTQWTVCRGYSPHHHTYKPCTLAI